MTKHSAESRSSGLRWRATGAAALMFCLSSGTYAQQEQQGQQQDQQQGQRQGDQQQQDPPAKPTYTPQDADRPPYSHDRTPQKPPDPQSHNDPPPHHTQPR